MSLTTSLTAPGRPRLRPCAARAITRTSLTGRQAAALAALLSSFPVALSLTALAASEAGPTPDQPLWQRGDPAPAVEPLRTAGDSVR